MKRTILFCAGIISAFMLIGCAKSTRIDLSQRTGGNAFLFRQFQAYDGRTGRPINFAALAKKARQADIILFGELHGDLMCNQIEAQLLYELLRDGTRQALAMEFFEIDEQSAVDAYLAGRIEEPDYLEISDRPQSYLTTHRPLIEMCRATRTPVLAVNAPRRLVREFRKFDGDYASFRAGLAAEDRQWLPPALEILTGPYRDRFEELMSGHGDMPAPPPASQPVSQPEREQASDPNTPVRTEPASAPHPMPPASTTTASSSTAPLMPPATTAPGEMPEAEPEASPEPITQPVAKPTPSPHGQPLGAETEPPDSAAASQPSSAPTADTVVEQTAMPPALPATAPASRPADAPASMPAEMPALSDDFDWRDFYRAQMLWDEAMAESIAAFRRTHPRRRMMLVVGAFHVTNDGGTTIKLFNRCPDDDVLTVIYRASADGQFAFDEDDRGRGDVVIYGISEPRE